MDEGTQKQLAFESAPVIAIKDEFFVLVWKSVSKSSGSDGVIVIQRP